VTPAEEEAAVAAWLAEHKVKRLPKRSATAPPIAKIRQALKQGKEITFTRGPSGRTVTFSSAPETVKGKAAREHLRAAANRRRRPRRSAKKTPA
jgi:seryl-tRNA(Sec) selenium transferase